MEKDTNTYQGRKMLIIIAYSCMIIFGLIETLKGVLVPSIRAEFLVDYTHIGQMLFISSLGYLVTTFFGGMAIQKYGLKKLFVFGSSVVIISTGLFSMTSSFYGVVGAYLLLGVGLGCFEGVNTLAGQIFVKNQAMMMNFMHLFFGVGAIIAPRYAGRFIEGNYSWTSIYLPVMALMVVILLFILFTEFPQSSAEQIGENISFIEIARSPKVWVISITLGLFAIMELGITNWLVNYLQVTRSFNLASSTSYLTGFFIAFTLGRLVGGVIADKVGYIKSLFYFTVMATITVFGGVILGEGFVFLFSVVGFFISIMFPTILVLIIKEYTYGVSTVMGFAIAVCGILNMIASWIIGKVNDLWGVSAGMVSVGICGIAACFLLIILNKLLQETSENII